MKHFLQVISLLNHHCIRRTLSSKYLGNLPFSGTFIGPQTAIDECFLNIPNYLENFHRHPIRMFECEDRVFVHIHMTATNLDTEAIAYVCSRILGDLRKFRKVLTTLVS